MTVLTIAALVVSLLALLYAIKRAREASDTFSNAALLNEDTERMLEKSARGDITIKHKHDPVLRPMRVMVVMMPDGDFEATMDSDREAAAAITVGSMQKVENMDYVIGVWPDGNAAIIKWRDFPADKVEVEAYTGS